MARQYTTRVTDFGTVIMLHVDSREALVTAVRREARSYYAEEGVR